MNRSELLAITCNMLKAREKLDVWGAILVFVVFLIGWKIGLRFLSQLPSEEIAIVFIITFDSYLKHALSTALIINI